jgi:hypothetical protein
LLAEGTGEIMLSDKMLTEIHAKVYAKHGYPFKPGLRAFMRGRRWAKNNTEGEIPPRGILDKLRMWAEINSRIQQEVIRARQAEIIEFDKEGPKNAKHKTGNGNNQPNSDEQGNGPSQVSEKSDGN